MSEKGGTGVTTAGTAAMGMTKRGGHHHARAAMRALRPLLLALLVLAGVPAGATPAGEQPALSDAARATLRADETLNKGLLAVVIADAIRNRCPSISGRLIRAFFYLKGLEGYARRQGYREEDVSAWLQDGAERERMFGMARRWLEDHGAKDGDPDSFCRVGREEIGKKSAIGKLLRDNGK